MRPNLNAFAIWALRTVPLITCQFDFNFCLQFGYFTYLNFQFTYWKCEAISQNVNIWQIDKFGSVNLNWINICSHPCHDFVIWNRNEVYKKDKWMWRDWKTILNQPIRKTRFLFQFCSFPSIILVFSVSLTQRIKKIKNNNDVPILNMQRLSTS